MMRRTAHARTFHTAKLSTLLSAALAVAGALCPTAVRAEPIQAAEIFDDGPILEGGDIEIVNGKIVFVGTKEKVDGQPALPDPAGDDVLELTDGSRLHGKLVTLGRNEFVWERADTKEPLTFAPQEIRRIVFAAPAAAAKSKANATVKLNGDAWLTGELAGLDGGNFRLNLEGPVSIDVARDKVEWLCLSPGTPPDAYEGPFGPMGMTGWEAGGGAADRAWDYADGALVARSAMPITRRFDALPDQVDIEFTASDGGNGVRGLTMWIQQGATSRGYAPGSIQLRFQGNSVNAFTSDGQQNRKDFSANLPQEKNAPKITRYRLLHDRRGGKFFVFANGAKVAEWEMPEIKNPLPGGSISWQPNYLSADMAWTLSKVKVQPWDGTVEPDAKGGEAGKDRLSRLVPAANRGNAWWPMVNGERVEPPPAASVTAPKPEPTRVAGSLEAISADSVKFFGHEFPRREPMFIRLGTAIPDDPPPGSVARVWLSPRGEFDVTALGFRDGKLKVRTSFSGDLAIPLAAVRAIEFPHRQNAVDRAEAEGGDTLVFKNGDELRGTLISATHDRSLKWKPVKGERHVEFAVSRVAGVLFAQRPAKAESAGGTAVRLRNGDWLMGELRLLDPQHLVLKSALDPNLQLDRSTLRTLYFGQNGEAPVWDGAADRDIWMKGTPAGENLYGRQGTNERAKRNPWQYLDGSFRLPRSSSRVGYGNGPNLGRNLANLPDKVEVSFQLSTPTGPTGYAIQLFSEDNRPGLMIQGSWDSAYIYDMSPRRQGGVFFNQPQQVDFGEKVGSDGNRRQFRFLTDRKTGRLTMLVNGIVVAQFGQRPGKESAKPGKGITITPQPMSSSVTVSDLWIAPWSGDAPEGPKSTGHANRGLRVQGGGIIINGINGGNVIINGAGGIDLNGANKPVHPADAKPADTGERKEAPAPEPAPPAADLLALINGDETSGTVESATAAEIRFKCDVGTLAIPIERALMAEFAGPPTPPEDGIRFRLAGKGTFTVKSFTLADGRVQCHSATAGDLSFPVSALSEIDFQPRNQPPPAEQKAGAARGGALPLAEPRSTFRGGGNFRGNIELNGGRGVFFID